MAKTTRQVLKATGAKESFAKRKLVRSLRLAGTKATLARRVADDVVSRLGPSATAEEIFDVARAELGPQDPIAAMRYNLKQAIMSLGPDGYRFESYVAKILQAYGYETEVDVMVRGACVQHEVDIVARRAKHHFMVECKYHNHTRTKTDLKVALYVQARFEDVRSSWRKIPGHRDYFHQGWLVTNTRVTTDAAQYSRCVGLRVISWGFPHICSLQQLIEQKKLYPVNIVEGIDKVAGRRLGDNDVLLASELALTDPTRLAKITGLRKNRVRELQRWAAAICR